MIQFEKLRVYDKKGSDLQWYPTSLIDVIIQSEKGEGAVLYPYINTDNRTIGGVYVKNGGFGYGTYDSLEYVNGKISKINGVKSFIQKCYIQYDNTFIGEIPLNNIEYGAINYTDSLGEHKSLYIKNIKHEGILMYDISELENELEFPSLTFTSALYTDKISTGLVETEHIHMFYQDTDNNLINIFDDEDSSLILSTGSGDSEIKLFEIESIDNSVCWCESVEHTIPNKASHAYPLSFNIGFTSEDEGVYENELNLYYNGKIIATFIVNSESIGEDERFRALLSNFNIPDPKTFSEILKDSDIKEAKPNWELINQKSKQFFLEYDNIFKFCGTYKGLVNAVKVLGYNDIYFREWFLDTKTSKRKTFKVSYGNDDISDTIKTIPFSERKTLKKLNSLSMVYQLNRETGLYDESGIPIIENVYNSDIKDIRIKMYSLKKWLEKNIIGVNCKITDITAEGVYFETYDNRINGMYNQTFEIDESMELTPYVKGNLCNNFDLSTIIQMDTSTVPLHLSVLETDKDYIKTKDIGHLTANDFEFGDANSPLHNVLDYMWRVNVKTKSSIMDEAIATNGLWIYNNTIKLKSMLNDDLGDDESTFITPYINEDGGFSGNKVNIVIEQAYLRDIETNEIVYSIVPIRTHTEDVEVDRITVDVETGDVKKFTDLVNKDTLEYGIFEHTNSEQVLIYKGDTYYTIKTFDNTDVEEGTKTIFKYAFNDVTKSHSLFIENFDILDGFCYECGDFKSSKYVLELIDGKIAIEPYTKSTKDYITSYINFNYDEDKGEQTIECNYTYSSPRLSAQENGDVSVDYVMDVNHCGDYKVELLTWNDFNMPFINQSPYNCTIIQNKPQILKYISTDQIGECDLDISAVEDNPLYDKPLLYQVKDVIGGNGVFSVITESYSYMHKIPYIGAYVDIKDRYVNTEYEDRFERVVNEVIEPSDAPFKPSYEMDKWSLVYNTQNINYKVNDVIHINLIIHEQGDRSKVIFTASCTARIDDIDDNTLIFYNEIIPKHIINLFNRDECTIITSPAWVAVDNIKTFRIEKGTEYEFEGNKLMLDFTNDNYILPYIDGNFDLSIEDFDVSYVKDNWIKSGDIKCISKVESLFESTHSDIILKPDCLNKDNIYIWSVYTDSELVYRLYNNVTSFKYEPNKVYNVYLERVDKYGNISFIKQDGFIKIKETVH